MNIAKNIHTDSKCSLSESAESLLDRMHERRDACIDRASRMIEGKGTSKRWRKYKKHMNAQNKWFMRIHKLRAENARTES